MSYLSKIAVAAALAAGLAGGASAATLSLSGGTAKMLTSGFGVADPAIPGNVMYGTTGGLAIGDTVTSYTGADNQGLSVVGKARLRFTLLGFEAGATNTLETPGASLVKSVGNIGSSILSSIISDALADFGFTTSGSPSKPLLVAFSELMNGNASVIALFDDGRAKPPKGTLPEPDYDDLIVQIDIVPVPVPAAGLMLAGALGGLAALRRRKAKA